MSDPVVTTMIILLLLGVGEFLSIISRARIPMLLVVIMGYLSLLWTGIIPKDMISSSAMSAFGAMMIAPLIVHMGTLVPFKLLKSQIRAVFIALSGITVAAVLVLAIIPLFFSYASAVAGIGPLTGGTIAFILTTDKLQELGLTGLITIPALVIAVQKLVGMPLAANFLRRHAEEVKRTMCPSALEAAATTEAAPETEETTSKSWIPEKYQTSVMLLLQLFIGGSLAIFLGNVTGISYSLWALIIGIIGALIGFYNDKMLDRSNSFGIAMAGLIIYTLGAMNDITPSMFLGYIPIVLATMGIGVIGIIVGGVLASKLMKWKLDKGVPVALTALFGFPGDYLLCEEVSRSVAENDQQQKIIFNEILTPMLVGGFTTVTTASIVVASILIQTL
ncbi:hypothetical protein JNUCC1_00674 [Lentibacillus sp. JNUCC-1]|uniref:hypothetical protein n=1 Tax=Lentibacillus sp. JNUCC-1 TaxID=2654513 RepID=UPI001327CBA9|nr:hypothetical protein [Lentibacillus sp. JNUCC-1]MUV36870.1 hypothetical protein [Lentibacillus sp. JNUCC-1]